MKHNKVFLRVSAATLVGTTHYNLETPADGPASFIPTRLWGVSHTTGAFAEFETTLGDTFRKELAEYFYCKGNTFPPQIYFTPPPVTRGRLMAWQVEKNLFEGNDLQGGIDWGGMLIEAYVLDTQSENTINKITVPVAAEVQDGEIILPYVAN